MKLLTRLGMAAAVIVATAAAAIGVTASPAAAATCWGYSCHGHDPVVYGCSATSTVSNTAYDTDGVAVAVVDNRYSAGCNANWARAHLTDAGLARGYRIQAEITTTDSHGTYEDMCYPGPSNTGALTEYCTGTYGGSTGWIYTDMVDGTNVTHAYVWVYTSSGVYRTGARADQ